MEGQDEYIEVSGFRYLPRSQHKLGEGTYGCVYRGEEISTGRKVAIKKQHPTSHEKGIPSCVLRETSLLTLLKNSPYVVEYVLEYVNRPIWDRVFSLLDTDITVTKRGQAHVHMIFELLDSDLNCFVKNNRRIGQETIKSIMYQIFLGLAHCHSVGVMHRDLKPHNILIDSTDPVHAKIGDFGFGRSFFPPIQPMTQEIVTLWYRAPEVLLGYSGGHTPAVDVWSMGCIFSELHERAVLFCGNSEFDQCLKIFKTLGTPSKAQWDALTYCSDFHDFPSFPGEKLTDKVTSMQPTAIDLLEKLLVFDPCKRLTAEQALYHPYFETVLKESDFTDWMNLPPGRMTAPSAPVDRAKGEPNEDSASETKENIMRPILRN